MTISQELVDILSIYNTTHHLRRTGEGWLYRTCRDNVGSDFVDVYKTNITELVCRQRVSDTLRALRYVREATDNTDLLSSVEQCLSFGTDYVNTLDFPDLDTRLVTETEFLNLTKGLPGVSKVFAHLSYYGNCKPEDLREDKYKLSRLKEGIMEVVTSNENSNRNRQIKDPNRWGLSVQDCEQVLKLIGNYSDVRPDGRSRSFNDDFHKIRGDRWGDYQYYHFYTSHAFKMFNENIDLSDIAAAQGCTTESLRNRLDKYAFSNSSRTLVRKYLQMRAQEKKKATNRKTKSN